MVMQFDPVQVELWRHWTESIAEEMGSALERTGFSPNIKERLDYSCAIFDGEGGLMAQAAHIPVHLGAMPLMMQQLRHRIAWKPGDVWLCNDPAHGGTHLPDFTVVAPVYWKKFLIGFVSNRAHHADIGGMSSGSLPLSRELVQEGIVIPPVRLAVRGRIQTEIVELVAANSRTPDERRGDLRAQVAAIHTGSARLIQLVDRLGWERFQQLQNEANLYADQLVGDLLAQSRIGVGSAEDFIEDDGIGGGPAMIRVTVENTGECLTFDFTGTDPQSGGSLNATEAVTRSACYYALRCLTDAAMPFNAGMIRSVRVITPEGTIVNPNPGAAVACGNVETSQRITDVVLRALSAVFPGKIPASSQGTMNNMLIGGFDEEHNSRFAYYETICGGSGGGPLRNGASAIQVHMTNTLNTPVEALEVHFPLRIREYSLRRGSGGSGYHKGGDGVNREVELLADSELVIQSERRSVGPPGLEGGSDGVAGVNTVRHSDGRTETLPAKCAIRFSAGTVVRIETPGGGGYGEQEDEV